MRLAQAARKISITTEDIVNFLAKRDIVIEKDSNTKLSEEAIELLFNYYDVEVEQKYVPSLEKEIEQKQEPEPEPEQNNESEISIDLEVSEESDHLKEPEEKPIIITEKQEKPEEIQPTQKSFKTVDELLENDFESENQDLVIKAPKVQLQGLNVLGKIDLPEPKPKKEEIQKDDTTEEKSLKAENKNRRQSRPKRTERRAKRELSPAEIRKREELKELRKRERLEAERKRKREAHYRENVLKPQQEIQKEKTKKRKKKTESVNTHTVTKPKPKTVLGKFWRWLNT